MSQSKGRGRPRSPWAKAVMEHVEHGPLPLHSVLSKTSPLVPPGRAYRTFINSRNAVRRVRGQPPIDEPSDNTQKARAIRDGQRLVVMFSIRSYIRTGRIELFEQGDEQWLRISPTV